MYPFHARLSKTKRAVGICLVWLSSIAVSYPYVHVLTVIDGVCWDDWKTTVDQFIFFFMLFLLICIIPTSIMIMSYTVSLRKIMNNKLVLGQVQDGKRHQQNAKILKMFIFIVVVFILLITPYFINLIIMVYTMAYEKEFFETHANLLYELNYGLFTIAAFNSCANCFIYAKMHPEVRKMLCRIYVPGRRTVSTTSTQQTRV